MSYKPKGKEQRLRCMQLAVDQAAKGVHSADSTRLNLPGSVLKATAPSQAPTPASAGRIQGKLNTPSKTWCSNGITFPQPGLAGTHWVESDRADADNDPYSFPVDSQDGVTVPVGQSIERPSSVKKQAGRHRLLAPGALGGSAGGRMFTDTGNTSRQLFGSLGQGNSLGSSRNVLFAGQQPIVEGAVAADAIGAHRVASSQWQQQPTGIRTKQTGILGFTVRKSLLEPGRLPAGMVNHGNTCYLNAVLQALLSLPCLAHDLDNSLQQLQLPSESVTAAVRTCLHQRTAPGSRDNGGQSVTAMSPAVVSAAMAKLSSRWGSYRQEDAHEFLTALLDAIQTEVLAAQVRQGTGAPLLLGTSSTDVPASNKAAEGAIDAANAAQTTAASLAAQCQPELQECAEAAAKASAAAADHTDDPSVSPGADASVAHTATGAVSLPVSAALCPASRNFSGCLQRKRTCKGCGHVTCVKEPFNHLSLNPPPSATTAASSTAGKFMQHDLQQQQQQGQPQQQQHSTVLQHLLGNAAASSSHNLAPIPDLQSLLADYFAPEEIEMNCEACGGVAGKHKEERSVRRLPRVLVVHLKRFQVQVLAGGAAICRKLSTRVRPDAELHLGGVCCPGRPVPPLLAELMPLGLLHAAKAATCSDVYHAAAATGSTARAGLPDESAASTCITGKRSRSEDSNAAVLAGALDGALDGCQPAGATAKLEHGQQTSNGANTAAAAGNGSKVFARTKKFAKMQTATGMQALQPGAYGARHTNLTALGFGATRSHPMASAQQRQQQQQQLGKKRKADTVDLEYHSGNDLGFTVCDQLPRCSSSFQLQGVNDEDAELQAALAASLQTAAEEQHRHQQQQGLNSAKGTFSDPATAAVAANADALRQSAKGVSHHHHHQQQLQAEPSSPRTPRSAPRKQRPNSFIGAIGQWQIQQQQPQQQQESQDSGRSGRGSDIGLSGGLAAFSGSSRGSPAGAARKQQQTPGTADRKVDHPYRDFLNVFAGLPVIAGDKLCSMPKVPPTAEVPVSEVGAFGKSSSSWLANDSLAGMTDEQMLAKAVAESLKDWEPIKGRGRQLGTEFEPTLAGSDAVGDSIAVDGDNFDEDAALQAALAESAALQEQELLRRHQREQGQQEQLGLNQDHQQQDKHAAAATAASEDARASEDAADDDGNSVLLMHGHPAANKAGEAAGHSGTNTQQHQQQHRRPQAAMVCLVEDSDCEDAGPSGFRLQRLLLGSAKEAVSEPLQHLAHAVRAAGNAGAARHLHDSLAAAADGKQEPDVHKVPSGKENQQDSWQQIESAGMLSGSQGVSQPGTAAKAEPVKVKKQRRPLGEILGSTADWNASNVQLAAAQRSPAKPAALAAQVAAASTAAAAASQAQVGFSGVAVVEAGAAAEVVGSWPQELAAVYRLHAVVRHKGPLASSGHFVSDVLNEHQGGQWFHHDDSYVQATSLPLVVRRCEADGYLFFYINSAILGGST